SASDKEQARSFGSEGITLYEAGKFQEALAHFHKANALYPTTQGSLYVARCNAKLGHLVRARDLYTDIVYSTPPKAASQNVRDAHAAAATELDALRPRIPTLTTVLGGPPSAVQVTIDGAGVPASELTDRSV